MSTTTSTAENGTDCKHSHIDHARFDRACEEEMTVTPLAPHMATVSHDGTEYTVDLLDGMCECPDYQYRNERCKHLLKAALAAIYTEGIQTAFVARVARYVADHPCPAGNHSICDGPTGPRFPCPDCVQATTVDEWTVWQQTAGRTGARR